MDGQKKDGRKERGKKTYFSSKIRRHCSITVLKFEVSNDNYITKIFFILIVLIFHNQDLNVSLFKEFGS